ncbi:MAG: MbcA/ParS/Xre antitoxin family protein [Verrucomicrobiota bacterium]
MPTTLSKAEKGGVAMNALANLRTDLVEEKRRLERLLARVDSVLRQTEHGFARGGKQVPAPRPSPMDQWKNVVEATKDLRLAGGNLSAERVAKLFGVSLSLLAGWLGRSKQAVSKTPDADSLQNALGYFERVARLRAVMESDAEFRKWLRVPHELLGNRSPLDLLAEGEWQAMADYVDDALTGSPT